MDGKGMDESGLRVFQQCYRMCCKSENITPLKNLQLKNNGHTLDFCVDRIRYTDWAPIFIALSDDLSLQCLAIRCRTQTKTILEQVNTERIAKNVSRSPVILTKFMLCNLVDSLSQCLSQTNMLAVLQMEGLPLTVPYITPVADAICMNQSLKHVSFHGCLLGDEGCQKICSALRCCNNVITLNLSACNITSLGAVYVAELIKFLKIYRYSENWKQTLRYQNPDLDSMPGLRRITLSENCEFGDTGLLHIIEVLLDDLWIKAVDLQQCGLTETIVKNCLQLLEFNSMIRILDIRFNVISIKSIGSVAMMLRKNENTTAFDQTWLTVSNTTLIHKDQKYPTKVKVCKKDKPLQGSMGHSFVLKNDENRSTNELIHINVLKEQLKQEIAHRRSLEELNERLLQQVKDLKQQQIMSWKTSSYQDTEDSVYSQASKNTNKQVYTIHLKDSANHKQIDPPSRMCNHNRKINIEKGFGDSVSELSNNSNISSAQYYVKNLKTHGLGQKIFTGADILEKLIEHRLGSLNGSQENSDAGNDFSSDSSSPETTVREKTNTHYTSVKTEN